ncbi:MAG: DNA repair and recombination protein RadB [Candidatus Woesearchaeota archaeon]
MDLPEIKKPEKNDYQDEIIRSEEPVKSKKNTEEHFIPTGNKVLDSLIKGFEKDIITTIYGPAGSGKTNFCILSSIDIAKKGKKVIYVDTDGSFSVERLKQITSDYEDVLGNMIFFRPMSFSEQKKTFENIDKIINEKVGIIIVDSIAMLYRLELGNEKDVYDVNRELGNQLTILTKIARMKNIPVLITNQVYSAVDEKDRLKMVGGNFLKYASKCLIEIREIKDSKKVILRKHRSLPKDKELSFEIIEEGVKETS